MGKERGRRPLTKEKATTDLEEKEMCENNKHERFKREEERNK
jgi:hypothetical protein